MNELRKVEVYLNDAWMQVPLSGVKKGERFRMFEPSGEVVTMKGISEFVADCDAYLNRDNTWSVLVNGFNEEKDI